MTYITPPNLANAIVLHSRMSLAERVRICDEIKIQQPALLTWVLGLSPLGVPMTYVGNMLEVLSVIHIAIKESGIRLREITENEQEAEFHRFVKTLQLYEELDDELKQQSIVQHVGYQKEPALMAHVINVLQSSGVMAKGHPNSKYVSMAAFTLVGCIANAEVQT